MYRHNVGVWVMNLYGAIWKELEAEIEADTTYQAQQLAVSKFQALAGRRKVKGYEITIALLKLNGVEYIHTATN
jgi:ribosomal protein L20A (L18A)